MSTLFEGHGWKIALETAPLPDGRAKTGARVYRVDSVNVIAFQAPGTMLLLREFRPFHGAYQWSLPGGKADGEADLAEAARRELREEAGMDARVMEYFCSGNLSDSLSMTNHIFVARDLFASPLPQDPDELLEVHAMTPEEALAKVLGSPKVHLVSAYGLMRYLRERQ